MTTKKTIKINGEPWNVANFEAANGLTIQDDLNLCGESVIKKLPDNLTVGGYLDLSGTQITALPDNLTVVGSLYLSGTQITALPDNLTVGGSLDLIGTQITALPDNLTVGGSLYLSPYEVSIPSATEMKIGCECHTIDAWEKFSDTDITAMDSATARKFWKIWKDPLIKWVRAVTARGVVTVSDDEDEEAA